MCTIAGSGGRFGTRVPSHRCIKRRVRDLNPRTLARLPLSRRVHSAALPTLPGHRILPYVAVAMCGLALALAGCSSDEPTPNAGTTSAATADAQLFELRPVLSIATEDANCRSETVAADERGRFCDERGYRYELGPTAIDGAGIATAEAVVVAGSPSDDAELVVGTGSTLDVVQIQFDDSATAIFAALTGKLREKAPPRDQLAIVVDGIVVSAPEVYERISGGTAQITGNFTEAEAQTLADRLQAAG